MISKTRPFPRFELSKCQLLFELTATPSNETRANNNLFCWIDVEWESLLLNAMFHRYYNRLILPSGFVICSVIKQGIYRNQLLRTTEKQRINKRKKDVRTIEVRLKFSVVSAGKINKHRALLYVGERSLSICQLRKLHSWKFWLLLMGAIAYEISYLKVWVAIQTLFHNGGRNLLNCSLTRVVTRRAFSLTAFSYHQWLKVGFRH